MTREQQREWATAIAEWAQRVSQEAAQFAFQARALCERLQPEQQQEPPEDEEGPQ